MLSDFYHYFYEVPKGAESEVKWWKEESLRVYPGHTMYNLQNPEVLE